MEKKKGILILIVGLIIFNIILLIPNNKAYQIKEDNIDKEEYNSLSMYIVNGEDETPTDTVPSASEYEIDEAKSYCKRGDQEIHDVLTTINNNFVFKELHTNDKCYLYFSKIKTASEKTLANLGKKAVPGETGGFGTIETADYSDTLYSDEDDFGTTYYFRGRVNNNWVKFGTTGTSGSGKDIYWRIIRINGDGTLRLIYSGEGSPATSDNGYTTSGLDALINKAAVWYNNLYNRSEYVGFEYIKGQSHGYGINATKSPALAALNTWFNDNLSDEFASGNGKIDPNAGFCNDRRNSTNPSTSWGKENDDGGPGSSGIYYGAHLRLRPGGNDPSPSNKSVPTFKCSHSTTINSDYFTYTGATGIEAITQTTVIGTKSLTWPVGLITADEATFAGGLYFQNNTSYYLNNHSDPYWTISPFIVNERGNSAVFMINYNGDIRNGQVNGYCGLRPVINLKADTQFKFDAESKDTIGTTSNPYIVQ